MNEPIRKPRKINNQMISNASQGDCASPQRTDANVDDGINEQCIAPPANRTPGQVSDEVEMIDNHSKNHILKVEEVISEECKNTSWVLSLWLMVAVFFVWLISNTVITVWHIYDSSWIMGSLLGILILALFVTVGRVVYKEVIAWTLIDQLDVRKQQILASIASNDLIALHEALEPTLVELRLRRPDLMVEFRDAVYERVNPEEYLKQFENIVLTKLDAEAKAVIRSESLAGCKMVMIIPHPMFDALAVLWQAKVLMTKIGKIYGLKPTSLSALRLIKHTVVTAAIVASTEELSYMVAAQVTENVLMTTVKALEEGSATTIRLYRLGVMAQKICRPITNHKSS